ncbi:hypothetical protein [Dickeya solani]|uniref:Uncharacterized protein n=1 Tax=Dickeya solani TaxID=1089444 RepID=A0AAX4F133_9GAMM|nr:hypothetical protein [Dickeya solani]AUC41983.1 hypothetical protein D083_1634 [Dickeya solani RNS 08.23.3.1.A]MCZ0786032.1 hypothetical protein [Dickeya solani]MCZ0791091.1 hypothetical protein [Dickeya solani]MCZ0797997.1 hypothetical protein [Dickeya solani]MCZ0803635.1 hypothetical protein [Dickeya solani]
MLQSRAQNEKTVLNVSGGLPMMSLRFAFFPVAEGEGWDKNEIYK